MENSNKKTSLCSVTAPQEASNYDELSMRPTLLFADNLKELKNLRKQLYSAAEHFELSYSRDEQKQYVVESVKDYITNAVVNTVDHLGSVAYKVTNFLDEKVDEFSGTEIQFSSIEQKLRTYQGLSDCNGISHQSLLIKTPKYHKKYIIPDVQATKVEPHPSLIRKGDFRLPPSSPGTFSFSKTVFEKELERGKDSPQYFQPKQSRTPVRNSIISPYSNAKETYQELQRSASVSTFHGERSTTREIQTYSKKSKPLFKVLFSMLRQKKDGKLYR